VASRRTGKRCCIRRWRAGGRKDGEESGWGVEDGGGVRGDWVEVPVEEPPGREELHPSAGRATATQDSPLSLPLSS
jgi:hypothetical protein